MDILKTDILIIGMGAAAQLAALYAHDANPDLKIMIITKALRGKGGCSGWCKGVLMWCSTPQILMKST
jgi:fumarate reductase flavoprotein subunit